MGLFATSAANGFELVAVVIVGFGSSFGEEHSVLLIKFSKIDFTVSDFKFSSMLSHRPSFI